MTVLRVSSCLSLYSTSAPICMDTFHTDLLFCVFLVPHQIAFSAHLTFYFCVCLVIRELVLGLKLSW